MQSDYTLVYCIVSLNNDIIKKILNVILLILLFLSRGDNSSQKSHSSGGGGGYPMPGLNDPGGGGYHPHAASNGHHSDGASPGSSQLSVDGGRGESTLITRTQKQHVTQNVSIKKKNIFIYRYLFLICFDF
jgi:hypothetical protein